MYKKLIFMTAVMCIGINCSCMAENTVNVSIDNSKMQINGTWENAGFLNFQIVPADYDRNTANGLISDTGVMFSDYAAADGTYSETFELPDSLKGGKYIAYVSDGRDELTKEFFYINYEETKPLIEKINSKALTLAEFETVVKENAEKFGVDGAELNKYADNILKPLYNARGEYTAGIFGRECRCAIVSQRLKDELDTDALIEEHTSDFGIDYKEDYAVLTDGEKKEFISKYTSRDMSNGNYGRAFVSCLAETRLSSCSNYTQYGDILIKYADRLEISLDKYNKLSSQSKAKVMDSLYTDREFNADTIVSAFNAAVEKYAVKKEVFIMKKTIKIFTFVLSLTLLITASVSVWTEEIPRSSVPQNATEESILITQNLISDILDEVSQGLGYLEARSKANNLIYNAVLSGQAGGYGYGLLSPIACNAIFEYRDIYLRPDFYVVAEADVRNLLADLIAKVETGMDYEEARKEAYTRIYRSVDPNFDPSEREMTDFCYWDTPAVDSAMFNRARKVLLEAETKYKTQLNVQ